MTNNNGYMLYLDNDAQKLNEFVNMTQEEWRAESFKIKQEKRRRGELY